MSDYFKKRQGQKATGTIAADPPKKKYAGPKPISDKKLAAKKAEKEARGGEDTDLQKWYKAIQPKLTGKCIRCGERYNHRNLTYAIAATAHVLPKRPEMFPSVATHPENYLELPGTCGCHNWYDNQASWEQIAQDKIWPLVLEKFLLIEPSILERSKIPEVLAQEIPPKM